MMVSIRAPFSLQELISSAASNSKRKLARCVWKLATKNIMVGFRLALPLFKYFAEIKILKDNFQWFVDQLLKDFVEN